MNFNGKLKHLRSIVILVIGTLLEPTKLTATFFGSDEEKSLQPVSTGRWSSENGLVDLPGVKRKNRKLSNVKDHPPIILYRSFSENNFAFLLPNEIILLRLTNRSFKEIVDTSIAKNVLPIERPISNLFLIRLNLSFSRVPHIIERYKYGLPSLSPLGVGTPASDIASEIVRFLLSFNPAAENLTGVAELTQRVETQIFQKRRIRFLLPAYPGKPWNNFKALGSGADLGELIGLITLHHICQQISSIYPEGASIILVSDGVICPRILQIPQDEEESDYMRQIRGIIARFKMPIEILTLKSFKGSPTYQKSLPEIRQVLDKIDNIRCNPKDYLAFVKKELGCPHYQLPIKETALLVTKKQKSFTHDLPEKLKENLQDLNYDQTINLLETQIASGPKFDKQTRLLKTISERLKGNYNARVKEVSLQIAEEIAYKSAQFSSYLSSITENQGFIRLSVNLHHRDSNQKLPLHLIYRSIGAPWHHIPVVQYNTQNGTLRVFMSERDKIPKLRPQTELLGPLKIDWME